MSDEPSIEDIERMSEEQVYEYLRQHGYEPEQVALEGEVFVDAVDALIENKFLHARVATLEAELDMLRKTCAA